jgi:hypothetical protein
MGKKYPVDVRVSLRGVCMMPALILIGPRQPASSPRHVLDIDSTLPQSALCVHKLGALASSQPIRTFILRNQTFSLHPAHVHLSIFDSRRHFLDRFDLDTSIYNRMLT